MSSQNPKIDRFGTKCWYNSAGDFHRKDGPAVEYTNGRKEWWCEGHIHRDDGPALELFDDKLWYKNGLRHREDGPAVEYFGHNEWWINDNFLTSIKFSKWT